MPEQGTESEWAEVSNETLTQLKLDFQLNIKKKKLYGCRMEL